MKVNSVLGGTDAPYLHFELVAERVDLSITNRANSSTQDAPERTYGPKFTSATAPNFGLRHLEYVPRRDQVNHVGR